MNNPTVQEYSTGSTKSTSLRLWNTLRQLPLGKQLFTTGVCFKAPYFGTIHPEITILEPARCEVRAPNRRGSRNHLGTFHAIASCNMAELAAGMMTDVTVPVTHRWIPVGMTVEYLAKAATDMRAVAAIDAIPAFGDDPVDLEVPVEVLTTDGTVAVRARITMRVARKKHD
ncbi:hotdog fold domain-containing protein [Rhodococcus koreensis]|uniref:hotdog fold domain-containing protein n=1 Tax=Rhodococcus koreensis TaxID=99653 RepID=UPI001F125210|nr:hotdog fold domain-containing protein [Rhodococcus koreensis]